MKRLFLSLFLILGTFSSSFAANNATDIYLFAQTKSTSELSKIENIDVVDSDGNTALCSAIKDNNIDAYNLLKKAGANTEHKCVKKIPAKQYQAFTQKLAATNKSWSFLGMGKWAWTAIGAGVVAGGAAAAMGGGGGGGSDTGNHYTPRFDEWLQEGYQYEPCQNGYHQIAQVSDWTGIPGNSEQVYMYKCEPNYCSYTTTECTAGYVETGNTCKSGETLYKECIPNSCDGYDYMSFSSCPEGWTTGSSCLSGTTMKYKCDSPQPCLGYEYTDSSQCPAGYTTGSSCLSGTTTKYMCDEPAVCSGYDYIDSTQCPAGYTTGSSCLSGTVTKYKCDNVIQCNDFNTTECTGGYVETGNTCQSGEILYKECTQIQCGANSTWTETGCICNDGYQNWQSGIGCSLTPINCGANAAPQGTQCVCDAGYENWQSGVGCSLIELNCGTHAHQNETQCVCDTGYQNWVNGVGCSLQPLYCGQHAYQNETHCECDTGYTNWTSNGCSPIALNCGLHAYQDATQCVCEEGYQNWQEGVGCTQIPRDCGNHASQHGIYCQCSPGYTNWTEGVGCYPILDCGNHAYQQGDTCQCEPGFSNWANGIGCKIYGITDTSNPNNTFMTNSDLLYGGVGKYLVDPNTHKKFAHNAGLYITANNNSTNITGVHGDSNVSGFSETQGVNAISGGLGIISINKTGTGDIIGLKGTTNVNLYNSSASNGYIFINNSGTGTVYGIKADNGAENVGTWFLSTGNPTPFGGTLTNNASTALGLINITNTNNSNSVYGIYGANGSVSNISNADETVRAIIDIANSGTGNVYGLYSTGTNQNSNINVVLSATRYTPVTGDIIINNDSNSNVYGIYNGQHNTYVSEESYYGPKDSTYCGNINITNYGSGYSYGMYNTTSNIVSNAKGGTATITMRNKGSGTAYGIYAAGHIYNANNEDGTNDDSYGTINIINYSDGKVFGICGGTHVFNKSGVFNGKISQSEINITNLGSGTATGIYVNSSGYAFNSGTININNHGDGRAFGIFGNNNSLIVNYGTINIMNDSYVDENNVLYDFGTSGDAFGIYAKSGSTVANYGTINVATGNGYQSYGIYAEGNSTVTNMGVISLNGQYCSGADCNNEYTKHIVLNGSTLYNSGVMAALQMNLNMMGGNVVAGLGSQFVVENELSGNLNISSELVQSGNQTTYIAENMIDAGDVSGLNIRSASAMFNASLADNGHDVVMQMKDFNELTDNASLATFLKNNYTNGNGAGLFSTLKSMDNMSAFNGTLTGLTGLNTFTQFAHEDLSAMREISFSMNNKLFENSNRDSFDISDSTGYFSFSNSHNGGNGQYGISSEKISDNWKLGYGMAMANINTGNGDNMHRQNKMWLFYMPATYTNDNYELVIAPKAGFANSEYNRRGYNNINYEGYIEKRIFGLMNDLRYPLTFGNWTIAPDLAFNTIVYEQFGHEDEQEFSLVIPDDRTVSVETGLGFYTKYEKAFNDGSKLKLNSGLMAYREFGDTYDIKLGIRGMDGTFSLYNNDYKYRAAASLGFDYMAGRLHMYGNTQYFMDNANYMNFKGGISYRF